MSSSVNRFITNLSTPLEQEVRDLYTFTSPSKFGQLSDEELATHITKIRNKAYEIAPWPCLGGFRFLIPGIANAGPPQTYSSIVSHLKANPKAKVLDLGCCFGHDARQLLKDGVKADQITACDLLPELIDFGYELFGDQKDQDHLKGLTWEKVDLFNEQDIEKIRQPDGYYAIYVGSFIHLFPLEWQQKTVAVLNKLLSTEKGSVVWGRQVGIAEGSAGPIERNTTRARGPNGIAPNEDGTRKNPFVHDVHSLKELFDGEASSNGWDGNVILYDWKGEKGTFVTAGDGEQMVDSEADRLMKRLSFAFKRK